MDNIFNVKISPDGKLSVYTKTKKFFREKLTKVSLIEFFNSSKRYLVQTGKYSIFPSMVGISPTTYLTNKAEFNLLNGFSDFNQRTTWKINNFGEEHKKIMEVEGTPVYEGKIFGSLYINDAKGNTMMKIDDFELPFINSHIVSEKEAELLLQNACNGVFTTARDRVSLLDEVQKNEGLGNTRFICEECGEIFDSLPEFFSHLIETGHKDSILTMHKYDPEIKKVIGLMNNSNKDGEEV